MRSTNGLKTPCYDEKNQIDCPNRAVGCHASCDDWGSYLQKRDEFYAKNLKKQEHNSEYFRYLLESKRSIERRIHKYGR